MSLLRIFGFSLLIVLIVAIGVVDAGRRKLKTSSIRLADLKKYPSQVGVFEIEDFVYICGATIVTQRHVVSAARCFFKKNSTELPQLIVAYGCNKIADSRCDFRSSLVSSVNLHPNYTEVFPFACNIAVLELSGDIEFGSNAKPIALPRKSLPTSVIISIARWGISPTPKKYHFDGRIRKQKFLVISNAICDEIKLDTKIEKFKALMYKVPLFPDQVCARPVRRSWDCEAGIGAGFAHKRAFAGILSWCQSDSRNVTVFTRVHEHVHWIRDIIKGTESPNIDKTTIS